MGANPWTLWEDAMISRLRAVLFGVTALIALSTFADAAPKPPAVDRDTVVMAVGKGFDSLDPQVVSTGSSQRYAWQMFDTLYAFDDTGNMVPSLATSYTISSDKLEYTFKLRSGVKFHDGEVMTATDVKYSLERILDPKTRSTRRPNFEPVVASIEAPSDDTIVFKLKTADGAFLNKIAGYLYIVPKKYTEALESPEAFGRKPVGTGPYKLFEQTIGQRLVIDRFEDYFGVKPAIKRIVFNYIPEPASRINALITGEADVADLLPTSDIERLKKMSGVDVMPTPIGSPFGIKFYTVDKSSPVANRDVRLALNYAVDANAIIKSVFNGAGKPIATYISSYYPYGVDPNLKPLGYDPKKARELLRKAGYPNGLQLTLNGGNDVPKELYEVVAAYWNAIGVKTKLNVIDYTAWIRMNNNHQSGPVTTMQFSNAIYDPIHVYYGAAAKDGPWSNYYNPEVEALIDQSSQTVDRNQRDVIFKKIGELLRDDGCMVPITELYIVFGKNSNLDWTPQVGISWYNLRKLAWRNGS
jgi:peptide/nickel transport system substrate-binding protein